MKKLLVIDYKDYTKDMPVFEKHTVRAVIRKGDKIAMQKSRYGEYKMLGGVVENGESHLDTLIREVEEEGGMLVLPETVKEIGYIKEKRRDVFDKSRIYVCFTYFYYCDVAEEMVPLKLTACEAAKGYEPAWETPKQIVACNQRIIHEKWKMRDTKFVNLLAEGKIHD